MERRGGLAHWDFDDEEDDGVAVDDGEEDDENDLELGTVVVWEAEETVDVGVVPATAEAETLSMMGTTLSAPRA